ncbi:MAG: SIS domain-containing protein [Candidatus Aegiribacteria sp.]|nr:SIS domain-containing protein [Candidatus Aegiribacteria sp.]
MSDIDDYLESAERVLTGLDNSIVERASGLCIECVRNGGTIFFCGNGGSAVDSQHLAGELVGRFRMERRPIPAIAVTANSAIITAIANDYDFSEIFSRQIEALGRPGDVLVAISTSGNSVNVLKAVETARDRSMNTIGFTGAGDCALSDITDICVKASSNETSHIQEALLVAGHAICNAVEKAFSRSEDS